MSYLSRRQPSAAGLLLIGISWAMASTGVLAQELSAEMPETLEHESLHLPLWVSSTAAGKGGGIRWELFDRYAQDALGREAEQIAAEIARRGGLEKNLTPIRSDAPYLDESLCVTSTVVFGHRDDPVPRDSFADLERYAFAVFSGEVVAISQGFFAGHPASLLEVEVRSVHAGEKELAGLSRLYVTYPYAAFALDGKVFCRQDPRYSYRPQVGDQVVLFPSRRPVDRGGSLLQIEPEEIFAQQNDKGFFIPRKLDGDPRLDGVHEVGGLRSLLPAGEQRKPGSKGGR